MKLDVEASIHVIHHEQHEQIARLDRIETLLQQLLRKEDRVMVTIDELLGEAQDQTSVVDSLAALTTSLKKSLDDALSGVALPPDVQAKVQQVFDTVHANKVAAANALLVNTPQQPPTPIT